MDFGQIQYQSSSIDICNEFKSSFRTIAIILLKLELPRPFFQNIQNPTKSQIRHQLS